MAKTSAYDYKNLTRQQQQCLNLIETLGIYELRALARVFGDTAPTTIKRDDHIRIVMDKIISGEDLKPIPLRQGRPYKELSNIQGILAELSQIAGKDYASTTTPLVSQSINRAVVTFNQVQQNIVQQNLHPINCSGVLQKKNDRELYFSDLDSHKSILVKSETFPQLKEDDIVVGTAVVMNDQNEYILSSVSQINYENPHVYKDKIVPFEAIAPTQQLAVGSKNILLGGRYILKGKFLDNPNFVKNTLASCKKNNIHTIALIPNMMYDDIFAYNTIKFDTAFMLKYEATPFAITEAVQTFLHLVKRLQQQGKNLALFVQDLSTLANAIDFNFKNNTKALMGHTEMAVEAVKNLIMLACASKSGSTTLFTTQDESDLFDQLFATSVAKVCKRI